MKDETGFMTRIRYPLNTSFLVITGCANALTEKENYITYKTKDTNGVSKSLLTIRFFYLKKQSIE